MKNLSLKKATYIEHDGLRGSALIFTSLGMVIFIAIKLRYFERNSAAWGSFNTKNCNIYMQSNKIHKVF